MILPVQYSTPLLPLHHKPLDDGLDSAHTTENDVSNTQMPEYELKSATPMAQHLWRATKPEWQESDWSKDIFADELYEFWDRRYLAAYGIDPPSEGDTLPTPPTKKLDILDDNELRYRLVPDGSGIIHAISENDSNPDFTLRPIPSLNPESGGERVTMSVSLGRPNPSRSSASQVPVSDAEEWSMVYRLRKGLNTGNDRLSADEITFAVRRMQAAAEAAKSSVGSTGGSDVVCGVGLGPDPWPTPFRSEPEIDFTEIRDLCTLMP